MERRLRLIILIIVFLAAGLFLRSQVGHRCCRCIYHPFSRITLWLGNTWGSLYDRFFPHYRAERDALELQLRELQTRLAATESMAKQNREMREMLGLALPPGWHGIHASVLTRDPARWNLQVILDKGRNDGIRDGAAALVGPYLAGRVIQTSNTTAVVALLPSPECRFSCTMQNGHQRYYAVFQGTAKATASGIDTKESYSCQADLLPKEAQLVPGIPVVTSGLGGQLPYGLPAAIITQQEPCPQLIDNGRAAVCLHPLANLQDFSFMTILVP